MRGSASGNPQPPILRMFQDMSTAPPEGPEGQGQTVAGQAASDGKDVAKAALKGAAVGGLAGAARGAAVAAVKSKTGRNVVIASFVAFLLAMTLVINVISGGLNSYGFEQVRASVTTAVVEEEVADAEWMRAAKEAGAAHGVEWQLLLAIHVLQDSRTRDKGTGPYGIDLEAAEETRPIEEEDAKDLDRSANYIASFLADALATTDTTLSKSALTTGAEFTDSDENGVDFHESESEEGQADYEEARRHHIAAMETLPIRGNPQVAEYAWDTARNWTLGKKSQCLDLGGGSDLVPETSVDLNDKQKVYAKQIVEAVAVRGMDQRAAIVALATVQQESKFRMYWNPKVPGSRELTDDVDAKGVDGYSVGLYQQQVNGNAFAWGSVEDAMSPAKSTEMFLDALQRIGGWEDMSIAEAAQAVQRSAHPTLYAQWESMARQLVSDLWPGGPPAGHEDVHDDSPGFGTREDGSHLFVNPLATPDLKAVEQAAKDRFGQWVYSMGDYRADGDHALYRAVDLMISDYKSPSGVANGDKIAKFFIDNAAAFGIEYLIWQDRIWLGAATGWKPYSTGGYGGMYTGNWNDTTRHMDHIHVNVYGSKGTGGDLVYSPPEGSDANDTGCPPVGGIGPGDPGNGDDYPFREPAGVCAWCSNVDAGGAVDPWSLYKRECVSFVAWRINQQMGWQEGQPYPFTPANMGLSLFGNAAEWSGNLRSAGFVTDTNPTKGSIAWWAAYASNASISTGAAGHVGIVTDVDRAAGTVTIEQYNLIPWEYSVMTIPIEHVTGFIHVADIREGSNNGPVRAV